jgi:Protein of unknown function (DUF3052)
VGTTAGPGKQYARAVVAMELTAGQAVQELGWDADVDESLREQVMDAIDGDLVDEALEAVDAVLLWWRDDDGDLVDGLVDALRDLSDVGFIWLLTPKVGRPGYVDPADIAEGAITAGLALANSVKVSRDWHVQKVVRPKASRR